jgi:DNA mismatch repair protein MutS2
VQPVDQWMDEQTKEWLGWSWIWTQFNPISVYGKEYKQKLAPFFKGEELEWLKEIQQTKVLQPLLDEKKEREIIEDALASMKDPRLFIKLLKKDEVGIETDWFHLKQFLWESRTILQHLIEIEPALKDRLAMFNSLLGHLQPEQKSFSLEDMNESLRELRQEKMKLNYKLQQLKEKRRQKVEAELQVSFQGKQQLYISMKDKELLTKCLAHRELQKERETPFEMIFSVKTSAGENENLQHKENVDKEIEKEERSKLASLAKEFKPYLEEMEEWCICLGLWDWRWTKAKWLVHRKGFCWPTHHPQQVHIHKGRYLPVEAQLSQEGKEFTPLSITMSNGLTTIVGSNMGGKSIAVKTIALLLALAHYGMPIPASSFSTPLFKRLVAISGDQQNIEKGLSTFGAEITRLTQVIEKKNQVLIMDELARGTNPHEGEALALAIGKYVAKQKGQIGVLITHFSILNSIKEADHYRVIGLEKEGQMNYLLVKNEQQEIPRHALMMAQILGLPKVIIEEAERQIKKGEKHGEATIRSEEN